MYNIAGQNVAIGGSVNWATPAAISAGLTLVGGNGIQCTNAGVYYVTGMVLGSLSSGTMIFGVTKNGAFVTGSTFSAGILIPNTMTTTVTCAAGDIIRIGNNSGVIVPLSPPIGSGCAYMTVLRIA